MATIDIIYGPDLDLNKIFHLTYNFDSLKDILSALIQNQKLQGNELDFLKKEVAEKNKKIETLERGNTGGKGTGGSTSRDGAGGESFSKLVEDRLVRQDDSLTAQKADVESMKTSLQIISKSITILEKKMKDFASNNSEDSAGNNANAPANKDLLDRISKLEELVNSMNADAKKAQDEQRKTSDDLERIFAQMKKYEDRLQNSEFRLTEIETKMLLLSAKVKKLGKRFEEVKDSADYEQPDESDDVEVLGNLVQDLRKELLNQFLQKTDLDDILQKIASAEKAIARVDEKAEGAHTLGEENKASIEEVKSSISDINDNINNVKSDIDIINEKLRELESQLSNKVNCEDFDHISDQLNNLSHEVDQLSHNATNNSNSGKTEEKKTIEIKQPRPSVGPSMSSKDQNKLKELAAKVPEIEEKLSKVLSELKNFNVQELKDKIKDIYGILDKKANVLDLKKLTPEIDECNEKINKLTSEIEVLKKLSQQRPADVVPQNVFIQLKQKVEVMDVKLGNSSKTIEEVRKAFEEFQQNPLAGMLSQQQEVEKKDDTQIQELKDQMERLKAELNRFRGDISKQFKDVEQKVANKVEQDALINLENSLLEKFDAVVNALSKKFADKGDTKKALKVLERQLKNLFDIFVSKAQHDDGDDAMFTKKPLGGSSCASCEKNLLNIEGLQAQFNPWGKLPFRDPSERIAKVGQGFSKMLSTLKVDSNQTSKQGINQSQSQKYFAPAVDESTEVMNLKTSKFSKTQKEKFHIPQHQPLHKAHLSDNDGYDHDVEEKRPPSASLLPIIKKS